MSKIRFGCQTYSWQMSYDTYAGKLPQIMRVMKESGFTGIEAEVCMMGKYFDDWAVFADLLQQYYMKYAALALPLNWRGKKETDEEFALAQKSIDYLKHFPGTILLLCHLPGEDRKNLLERQMNQIACTTEIAKRAKGAGIITAFHPNSSFGSAFRTREDYDLLLDSIAGTDLGYCPDAGHIAHGDMDPVEIIRDYAPMVKHVHFKDMNSEGIWESMGQGCINFPQIVCDLDKADYSGWIMVEEESAAAQVDPNRVTRENGIYLKTHFDISEEE